MTNAMIIFNASQQLAREGKIEYTGREFTAIDAEGKEIVVKETEQIHTYATWKQMGYQVKKGEKAIAQFVIWKYKANKKSEEADADEKGKMFMKKASFFRAAQVE